MSDDLKFFRASEGENLRPLIAHECETLGSGDGTYEQVYNFYDYVFADLPDATAVNARVYFGEREAFLRLNTQDSPQSAKLIVEYFKRRLFARVMQLGSSGSYEPLWQDDRHGR